MLVTCSGGFAFCYQVYGYFVKWSLQYVCHLQRVSLNLGFSPGAKCTVSYVFPDVLVHALPIILAFYEAVCMSSSLVTKFSCASMNTVYFQVFGMTRAKNFWFESVTCLYSNSLMRRKRSASCCGAFPFDRHLEIHLQNESILCICSRACSLSSVSGFDVVAGVSLIVVMSGVTLSA